MRSLTRFTLLALVLALAACDSADEPQAELRLSAESTATASPSVGDAVEFTFTLSNDGPNASSGARVSLTPSASLTDITTAPSVGTVSGDVWTVPALAVGSDAVLTLTAVVATAGPAEIAGAVVSANEANPNPTPALTASAGFSSLLRATVADVYAPVNGIPPNTGGPFAFYSLRENRLVLSSQEAGSRADSASTDWDLAIRGTTILTNGGTSGPGQGGAVVVESGFETLTEIDPGAFRVDADGDPAIPTGSGNGWYLYDSASFTIRPRPGYTLAIRTADGRYAKVRIRSYYQGAPDTPDGQTDASRYYTFDYVFQPDGTGSFQ